MLFFEVNSAERCFVRCKTQPSWLYKNYSRTCIFGVAISRLNFSDPSNPWNSPQAIKYEILWLGLRASAGICIDHWRCATHDREECAIETYPRCRVLEPRSRRLEDRVMNARLFRPWVGAEPGVAPGVFVSNRPRRTLRSRGRTRSCVAASADRDDPPRQIVLSEVVGARP